MCTYIFLFLSFSSLAVAAHVSVPLTIIWRIGCRSCPWIRSVFGCRSLTSQARPAPGQPQARPAQAARASPRPASQPLQQQAGKTQNDSILKFEVQNPLLGVSCKMMVSLQTGINLQDAPNDGSWIRRVLSFIGGSFRILK